jgi:hypothetical protein
LAPKKEPEVVIEVAVEDTEEKEVPTEEKEVHTEAVVVKAEEKAEAKEETTKVKAVNHFKKVSTDQEAEVDTVEIVVESVVVVALVKAEAVAELSTDQRQQERVKSPKVMRANLLLIERKKLIIEERTNIVIKANQESNIILMIEEMELEEVEGLTRQATEKETGVILKTKLKDKFQQLKVPLKNQRLKVLRLRQKSNQLKKRRLKLNQNPKKNTPRTKLLKSTLHQRRPQPTERKLEKSKNKRKSTLKRLMARKRRLRLLHLQLSKVKPTM